MQCLLLQILNLCSYKFLPYCKALLLRTIFPSLTPRFKSTDPRFFLNFSNCFLGIYHIEGNNNSWYTILQCFFIKYFMYKNISKMITNLIKIEVVLHSKILNFFQLILILNNSDYLTLLFLELTGYSKKKYE